MTLKFLTLPLASIHSMIYKVPALCHTHTHQWHFYWVWLGAAGESWGGLCELQGSMDGLCLDLMHAVGLGERSKSSWSDGETGPTQKKWTKGCNRRDGFGPSRHLPSL